MPTKTCTIETQVQAAKDQRIAIEIRFPMDGIIVHGE